MTNPFKIPYKEVEKTRGKVVSIFVFGLFIFLFLYFFKPFGINQLNPKQQFFITLGFGFVTTFMLFIFKYLVFSVWTTILVGSIPVTISHIITLNRLYKAALIKASVTT